MNLPAPERFIPIMVARIVAGFQPARIVLFGSHARDAATRWSDVDLLVIFPTILDKRRTAIEIRRALGDLPVGKDIVVATLEETTRPYQLDQTVLGSALREGKTIYERPRSSYQMA